MGINAPLRLGLGAFLLICSGALMAQNAMTTEGVDLYAGPDNAYPVVAQLDPNTPIQVMGCLDDWSWCDVAVQDARGWMYSPDITYQYEGGYVPLYSYAPSLGIAVVPFSVDMYWGRYYHNRPWYGRREEWAHRTVEHRRPPGPPPSAGPPPRPEHRDGPREAARDNDRPLHLGRAGTAEPPPQNRNDERRPEDRRPAENRPNDRRPDEGRPDNRRPEPPARGPDVHAAPAPHPAPETHAVPAPHEEHARPAAPPAHAAPAPHEERPRPAPQKEEEHPH
jgi:uncharacterized protein YraI